MYRGYSPTAPHAQPIRRSEDAKRSSSHEKKSEQPPPPPRPERMGGRTALVPSSGERVGVSAEEATHRPPYRRAIQHFECHSSVFNFYDILPGIRYPTTVEVQDTYILPGTCCCYAPTSINSFLKSCHPP